MKARDENVVNELRRHRLLHGELTQQALAEAVGVSRQTIVSIEKGHYNPTVGLALRLAHALGVAVEDLFQLARGRADGSHR
ncbi:MAG TPA: helix-turn-helix transcriptional regulator [Candidatus Krumholzibacteria bacterium]|nr:helix-turn-helix transcriptional regulator [Candidatus Krumholzibacteria bacterium]HPD72994.1 helix-turn-helix transcriptional regulator [Candidatus Krumholzibacteria bacterium]HRY41793.1 helix-turn-helix transcriptional regulator [Candidatus Krumholzibacteria bacterium]